MFKKILDKFLNNSKIKSSNVNKSQEEDDEKIEINDFEENINKSEVIVDAPEEIILTEDEINQFIEQEIAERMYCTEIG